MQSINQSLNLFCDDLLQVGEITWVRISTSIFIILSFFSFFPNSHQNPRFANVLRQLVHHNEQSEDRKKLCGLLLIDKGGDPNSKWR